MATPTGCEARLYAAGAKKAGTWGTAVALGTGNEIKLIKSADLPMARKQDYLMLKESDASFLKRGIAGGVSACDFTPEAYMRYDAGPLGEFIAELFGTAGTPATVETGVYKHTFQWADSSAGLFSTYAEEYPGKIYEVPTAKPMKVVFSLQDGILKIAPTLRGNTVVNDSSTNTATQMDALTVVNAEDEVRFDQCVAVWMAEYPHADALAATEARTISGMELSFARGLETSKMTAGATYLAEAQEEDFSDIRVKLDFPYDDAFNREFFSHFIDDTNYQLVIKFKGLLLGATEYYQLNFWFPKLRLAAIPDLTKEGLVKVTAEFQAVAPDSAPTGFSYARPYLELQNAKSADYLA